MRMNRHYLCVIYKWLTVHRHPKNLTFQFRMLPMESITTTRPHKSLLALMTEGLTSMEEISGNQYACVRWQVHSHSNWFYPNYVFPQATRSIYYDFYTFVCHIPPLVAGRGHQFAGTVFKLTFLLSGLYGCKNVMVYVD